MKWKRETAALFIRLARVPGLAQLLCLAQPQLVEGTPLLIMAQQIGKKLQSVPAPQLLESCHQQGINVYWDTAYRYRQNLQGSYCIVFSRCCFVDRVFFLDLFFTLLVFTCSFHTSQGIKEGCRTSQCRLAEVRIDFNSRYSSPASAEPRLQRDTHG